MSNIGLTMAEAAHRSGELVRSDASVAALEIKILRLGISRLEQRFPVVEIPLSAAPPPPAGVTSLHAELIEPGGGQLWGELPRLPLASSLSGYALSLIGRCGQLPRSAHSDRVRSLAAAVRQWIDDPERRAWEANWHGPRFRRPPEEIARQIATAAERVKELKTRHTALKNRELLAALDRFGKKVMGRPNSAFVGTAELRPPGGRWQPSAVIEWAAWLSWHRSATAEASGRFGHVAARNLLIHVPPPAGPLAPQPTTPAQATEIPAEPAPLPAEVKYKVTRGRIDKGAHKILDDNPELLQLGPMEAARRIKALMIPDPPSLPINVMTICRYISKKFQSSKILKRKAKR